jgi:hypothetical protein
MGEYEKVRKENITLANKVDSLQNLLSKFDVVTDLNNHIFKVDIGEQYTVESMAVLKKGLELDSVVITKQGTLINKSSLETKQGFFGPVIMFTPEKKGTYNIEAYVSSFAWGDRKVKTEWTIFVED